jgi:hypothetical protein
MVRDAHRIECWGSLRLTPAIMPINIGTPMDENPLGADPIVIFTATYGLWHHQSPA